MEFRLLGAEVEHEVEDITCQFAIAQSLQDTRAVRTESSEIFSAIRLGDERALQKLCAVQKDRFLERDGRGWIPLHQAASQKNITILQLTCAASGLESLECVCHLGKTPLFMAVEGDLIENTCFLLQQGASPSCPDNSEDPPLLVAVRTGHSELVSLLLRWDGAVNQRGRHGRTALHEASRLGLGSLVRLLLEAGALPDPRSYYGLTPLALAAQGGHLEVVERLLDSGADVCSQAQDEASILFEACVCGDPALIRTLLQHGADANARTHTGHLPIHRAAHRGHLMALKLLIPVTSMECVHDSETSPLHASASAGHTHCIKALLDAGYDPNFMPYSAVRHSIEDERRTALFYAVSNNDVPCVKLLLDGGAMPNLDPVKCLQVALRMGNYEMINLLLRFGANVNYYCWVNTTHFPSALQYAFKDQVILRMLCNYGYDVERCFQCPYGDGSHVPDDFEGWSNTVIKDTTFCEVIAVYFLKDESGHVVLTMLDYVDHVTFCSKLNSVLKEQQQWPDICRIQENVRSLQHLCRLKIRACLGRLRLRAPVFMSFLPLPQRLKDYILYREYDLYRPEGIAGLL